MTLLSPRSTLFPYTTLFRSRCINLELDLMVLVEALLVDVGLLALGLAPEVVLGQRWPLTKDYLRDRKSTRLNSSHVAISYAVFCLKKKKKHDYTQLDRGLVH